MVSEIFMCHADTARIYMYTKGFKYVSLMWMNISLLLGLYGICSVMIGNKMRNVIYALGHIYCLACLTISSHDWFNSSVEVIPINVKKGLYTHETEKGWMQDGSPARVLEQANEAVCRHNEVELFVTVWFGVLEISTGRITAANAGHEYPIIRKPDGEFELLKGKHSFVIGGMEGMKYKEQEFYLEKGGAIFLYTDGVPEATNPDNALFGTDRLLTALNKDKNADPRAMLQNVKGAVDKFVGDAEQFDDMTMLGLIYKG